MNAPPAFQFYAADYLADEHVQLMSLEEEGVYIRLLAYCWREGSIPANPELLSRLCKGGSTDAIRLVLERFEPHPDQPGRLVHPRLEEERRKQEEWREKSSAGGKKSAETRARKAAQTVSNHPSNGGSTLQSSSSSSTTKEKPSRRDAKASPKPANVIWDLGVNMLTNSGWTESNARTFIGKQSQAYGRSLLAQAVSATSAANPANPCEYLIKTLQGMKENGSAISGGNRQNAKSDRSEKNVSRWREIADDPRFGFAEDSTGPPADVDDPFDRGDGFSPAARAVA